ncbi:MAG: type II secretion system F family protein, partial [Planctomycetaceae bacterium]
MFSQTCVCGGFEMPEFAYTARTAAGQDVNGLISAESRGDVLALLTDRSLFPLIVEQSKKKAFSLEFHRPIKTELLAATLTQLSDLLSNGVPLLKALEVIAAQASHPKLQDVLADIRSRIADGKPLDEAMAAHPGVFSDLVLSIVRAGTEGAFLEESLKQTAAFLERQEELRSRIRGAMAYPAFLAAAGSVVTIVLIVFFVPKFAELFAQLEQQGTLPWATIVLLWLSDVLGRFGIFLLIALCGALMGARRW